MPRSPTCREGPLLLVANEFFDALPIRQFVRARRHVARARRRPRRGGPTRLRPRAGAPRSTAPEAPEGAILEVRPARDALAAEIARRIVAHGGAALIIDYGHAETAPGDTLQAMRGHAFADPLAAPGEADLTAHVDFAALARRARAEGAAVHGPITQGEFLLALGLLERAGRLGADKSEADAGGAPRGRGTPRRAGADGHALQGARDHAAGRRPAAPQPMIFAKEEPHDDHHHYRL